MPACKIVLWTVCSGNVLLRFHFHWTYHYFLWYLNNCKANNYSSSCSDLPPPQRQISHIRCQRRQTLYDLQSLVGQFICSSQPWIINQVSYSVSCCCAVDDKDGSASSSCSCLACDFCLHSYSVVHIPASEWQTQANLCNTRNNARHDISSGIWILSACNGTHPPHSAISTC